MPPKPVSEPSKLDLKDAQLAASRAALAVSEERLRLATEAAEVGFWDVDLVNDLLIWPPIVKRMFGISPDVPVTLSDFYAGLHPDDLGHTQAAFLAACDPDLSALYDVEYRTVGKEDGLIRWVAAKGRGIFEAGRCVRVVGTAIDITRRRQAEEALRNMKENLEQQVERRTAELRLYQDIVEATASAICAFDTDFRLIAFNKAHNDEFRRVNGFDTKLGDVFPDLFIEEQGKAMRALMARALAGQTFTVTEIFGREKFGQPMWEITYTPLRDQRGRVVGAFHLANDISARLQAEDDLALAQEALRQSQKMEAMGSLTGGVAHDFNNLLTPIVGSLDLLQRRGLGGEREQRLIAGAVQSAERARVLVQRLLAFARRQPLQPQPVDVGALVSGMADLVASTSGPQTRVVVDVTHDLPSAVADENQIEMAILNLSVNARDAMPNGGRLTVSAREVIVGAGEQPGLGAGRYIQVAVSDTGVGMDAETLRRAVEPFFSTKGIGRGTGLGLSMVHGLAAQLGGALTIDSRPGLGTSAKLWLPATDAKRGGLPDTEVPVATASTGQVLLVDDEEVVRASTAEMLADLGYEVSEAPSAEAALALLDEGLVPDLLVTDHLMPGKNGTDFAREFLQRFPHRRVLVVSGYAEVEGIAPDLPRLVKPFRLIDLATSLKE